IDTWCGIIVFSSEVLGCNRMKKALLFMSLPDSKVACGVCQRRCVIAPGKYGFCGTRVNVDGELFSMIYDRVSAINVDPIEKKPLYHFHPGSLVYSLGTLGCSFSCPGCQNWGLSHVDTHSAFDNMHELPAEAAVQQALAAGVAGICWTYNDPAIWLEYTLAGAKLAKKHGLYTAYVTNGSATREHIDMIGPYLDAYRVDVKGFSDAVYQKIAGFSNAAGVRDGIAYAKYQWGMHVEIVTNVTPTINDSEAEIAGIADWIVATLGVDTPWHLTRFHPCEDYAGLPMTPTATLERCYQQAHKPATLHLRRQRPQRSPAGYLLPQMQHSTHPPQRFHGAGEQSSPWQLPPVQYCDRWCVG
ncbi:MAG: radical SAM protein, partial [bacterium]